jgi:hypothetical protein
MLTTNNEEEAAVTTKAAKGKKQTTLSKFTKRKAEKAHVEDETEVLTMPKTAKKATVKSTYKKPSADDCNDTGAGCICENGRGIRNDIKNMINAILPRNTPLRMHSG